MKGASGSNSKTCSVASSTKTTSSRYSLLRSLNGKSIHHSISSVQKKIKAFKRKHLVSKSKIDTTTCAKCLEVLVFPQWDISSVEGLATYDQFLRLTLRKPLDEEIVTSDAFIDLLSLSEKAQDFDALLKDGVQILSSLLEQHVMNTCVSLKEEDEGGNSTNVSEYDEVVGQFRSQIRSKWEEIESVIEDFENSSRPFLAYVRNGDSVSSHMRKVCNLALEVCKLADEWVTEDELYPAKLEQEMVSTASEREEIQQSIQQIHEKKAANTREIERLQKLEVKAERLFHDSRKDKRKTKQHLGDLEERKKYLNASLSKKREEREQLKSELSSQGQHSFRGVFDINARMTSLETAIDRIEEQKKVTARQLNRIGKDLKPITDKTYENKVEMVTFRHHKENLIRENHDLDIDLNTHHKRLTFVNGQITRLKNIREMKLSGEAFRKSMRVRHRREVAYANGTHDLEEACKVAASGIGKDWKSVYFRLPFDPPRDPARLQRDVSVLDHISYRRDVPPEKQALKCLERWRTLHRKGDIHELIQTLREVKKKRLALELHNRFVPVAV